MKDSYLNVDFSENRSKLGHRCSQNENSGFGLTVNVRDRLKYGKITLLGKQCGLVWTKLHQLII